MSLLKKVVSILTHPSPLKSVLLKNLQRFGIGDYKSRLELGAVPRPHYGYCVYQAALLAKKLGHKRISVLEFGVAGGRGLLTLEYHAEQVEQLTGVGIEIYGFDAAAGLPEPIDYRDIPYHWKKGFYRMDKDELSGRLKRAKLVLGDIASTGKSFFRDYSPAPIGAIFNDLDLYSSTVASFSLLESEYAHYLPRIFSYFDDTVGSEKELYNDYTGQRCAINEFNSSSEKIKFGLPYYLFAKKNQERWFHKIWICHLFSHPEYNKFVSDDDQHLDLM